jgi:hypothetical protein
MLTLHLARHVIFRTVKGDQHMAAQLAETLEAPSNSANTLAKGSDRDRPERPDMIVTRDPIQAEQRRANRPALALVQPALMRQERRALQEEQGKRRHVRHRVVHIASLPDVRQRVAASVQRSEIQNFHASEKSLFRRCGNPPKALQSNFPPTGGAPDSQVRLSFSWI